MGGNGSYEISTTPSIWAHDATTLPSAPSPLLWLPDPGTAALPVEVGTGRAQSEDGAQHLAEARARITALESTCERLKEYSEAMRASVLREVARKKALKADMQRQLAASEKEVAEVRRNFLRYRRETSPRTDAPWELPDPQV